jgi:hypothetical protein
VTGLNAGANAGILKCFAPILLFDPRGQFRQTASVNQNLSLLLTGAAVGF